MPFARNPSYITGFNSALDKYIAAVCAAGPDPMITTFVCIFCILNRPTPRKGAEPEGKIVGDAEVSRWNAEVAAAN